ncbi:hypothetical protein Tsubulata_017830 [Turnera subulata]|uniref:LOB domain-containing protein n=1 Tax=Turnera subulata TaxID=218843 RepID=A0A9Q0J3M4_9ROSI|nr:hypothetical protein Tsubulata_017830 [Turnera subulata]
MQTRRGLSCIPLTGAVHLQVLCTWDLNDTKEGMVLRGWCGVRCDDLAKVCNKISTFWVDKESRKELEENSFLRLAFYVGKDRQDKMSSSNSPCAACKFLRRKCTPECVYAPYFPPDQPQKFASVHKVFGASNVAKILNELPTAQREDAVNSLAYEAEERLRDPVYGCVGLISILQHRLKQLQADLNTAKKELASYIGPQAMLPMCNLAWLFINRVVSVA